MEFKITELPQILDTKIYNIIDKNLKITGISLNSKKVKKGDLFIPFIGNNVDGHDYIEEAFKNGAVCSLSIKKNIKLKNKNIIFINDSLSSIQKLAMSYLKSLHTKVIAITGSNGKTTTKDIIAKILSTRYKVHKTKSNNNNELGVPITILSTPCDTDILILEMGADNFGQLKLLSELSNPDFCVITNIGESHIEFFKTRDGIAKEKFEITRGMKKNGILIYNGDEPLLNKLVLKNNIKNISCGFNKENVVKVDNYSLKKDCIDFKLNIMKNLITTKIKGKHNILNITYAITIAKKMNINEQEILDTLHEFKDITKMRLEEIPYGNNSLIINDAYNASPTSMKAAIDVLNAQVGYNYKRIILGDMYELGKNEILFHENVGKYINDIKNNTINEVISIGKLAKNITKNIKKDTIKTIHFDDINKISDYIKQNKINNEILLFKASRSMQLEKIIEYITK